jgi:hypothetical protein
MDYDELNEATRRHDLLLQINCLLLQINVHFCIFVRRLHPRHFGGINRLNYMYVAYNSCNRNTLQIEALHVLPLKYY